MSAGLQSQQRYRESKACDHSLIYYQKPCIGNERGLRATPPVQLVFPGGGFGLGVSVKETDLTPNQPDRDRGYAVLASGPERTSADIFPLRGLQATFLILAFFNIVITSLLFVDADKADTSNVARTSSPWTGIFESVPSGRRGVEEANYAMSIVVICLGSLAVVMESAVGVSAYCLATLLNFVLSTSALPYFVYSFRYIFDLVMLYFALVLRTRLMYTFLPLHARITPPAAA